MAGVATAGQQATDSRLMGAMAHFGLAARAFVYLVIGWLAIQIALGHRHHQANQHGALADVAQHSYGIVLLWLLAVGFAAYAIWRLAEAAYGTAAEGRKTSARLESLGSGIIYGALCVSTFGFIGGRGKSGQAQQQASLTARIMHHSGGRWLVGIVGLVVAVIGLVMVVQGARKSFEKRLRMDRMHGATRTFIVRAGVIGTIARGIVVVLTGALVTDAAVTFDPAKSTGLDGALNTLADRPYGPVILGVVALGLVVFGLFGFAEARYAKTSSSGGAGR